MIIIIVNIIYIYIYIYILLLNVTADVDTTTRVSMDNQLSTKWDSRDEEETGHGTDSRTDTR